MKRLAIIGFLMLFAAVAYAQQGLAPYDVLVRSAKIYLGTKDYDKAKALLDSAVNNYPNEVEAHYLVATIYSDRGDYAKMMDNINKFEEIYAKAKASGDKKMIKACEKDKMPEQVRNIRLSALKKEFQEGVAQLKLADSLSKESRKLEDDSLKAEQEKQIQQLYGKAEQLFQVCAVIDDTVSGVYTNLALTKAKMGDEQAALDLYRKAHALNPKDVEVLFSLASTYFSMQNYDSAAVYYGDFAAKDSLNREAALINQALCYQALKDEGRLESSLDNILQVNPKNPDILYQRGILYVRKASSKVLTDSARVLDSLMTAHPDDQKYEKARDVLTAERVEFYKLALPDFKAAAEITATDPDYWYWYGNAAVLVDSAAEARTAYEKCISLAPENKDCWCQLVTVYAKLKLQKEFDSAKAKCESLQ